MSKEKEVSKSYGIKETYVAPLTQRLIAVQKSLEDYQTSLGVVDALNKLLILISSLTRDLQEKFDKDINRIEQLLFDEPTHATGITKALVSEHAKQTLQRIGMTERVYARRLFRQVTLALDKKGWLDKSMRDIPRNF